jgi:hypothetical protein
MDRAQVPGSVTQPEFWQVAEEGPGTRPAGSRRRMAPMVPAAFIARTRSRARLRVATGDVAAPSFESLPSGETKTLAANWTRVNFVRDAAGALEGRPRALRSNSDSHSLASPRCTSG